MTVRADGSAKFDVRFTLQTDHGANMLVTYTYRRPRAAASVGGYDAVLIFVAFELD